MKHVRRSNNTRMHTHLLLSTQAPFGAMHRSKAHLTEQRGSDAKLLRVRLHSGLRARTHTQHGSGAVCVGQ
jgi:hypothetical protein